MLSISLTLQLIGLFVGFKTFNNLPFYHAIAFIEFVFLWIIYRHYLQSIFSRLFLNIVGYGFIAFFFISAFFLQWFTVFPSYVRFIESILIIFFAFSYFSSELKLMRPRPLHKTFMFWLSTGFLIHLASGLLISLFGNLLIHETDQESWNAIWVVHNLLNIFLYICLITAFCHSDPSPLEKSTNPSHN